MSSSTDDDDDDDDDNTTKMSEPVWYPQLTDRHENDFLSRLYSTLDDTADVTIIVDGKEFKAHKAVLAVELKELYGMIPVKFSSNTNNYNIDDDRITLLDKDVTSFAKMLDFIYTGKKPIITQDMETAKAILLTCNRYGCSALKLYVESLLVDKFLVPSTAADLLLFSDSYTCPLLKEAAMDLYAKDCEAFMDSATDDWTKLKESNNLLVELLIYTNSKKNKYSPGRRNSIISADEFDDFDVTDLVSPDDVDDVDDVDVTTLRERLQLVNQDVDGSRRMLVNRLKKNLRTKMRDTDQYWAWDISKVIVSYAGYGEVNGVYKRDGLCEGVPKFSKHGLFKGINVTYSLFKCNVSNNTQHWYISVVPNGTAPGTTNDIDFYSASVTPDSQILPPSDTWMKSNEGIRPNPKILVEKDVK